MQKNPKHPFVDIAKLETQNFKIPAKNICFYGSWSLSRFSVFQTKYLVSQKQWSFVKFAYGIFLYSLVLTNYLKNQSL